MLSKWEEQIIMRDDKSSTRQTVITRVNDNPPIGVTPVPTSKVSTGFSMRSYRSEIKEQPKLRSRFRLPMTYDAVFITATPYSFEYLYSPSGSPSQRWKASGISAITDCGPGVWGWGTEYALGVYSPAVSANMRWELNAKLLSKMRNEQLQVGQFIAELNRTHELLRKTIAYLLLFVRVSRAMRKPLSVETLKGDHGVQLAMAILLGKSKRGFGLTRAAIDRELAKVGLQSMNQLRRKSLDSAWLEFVYGWTPLVKDLYAAFESLRYKAPTSELASVKAAVTRELSSPTSNGRSTETSGSCKVGIHGKIHYGVSSPILAMLDDFGLLNPASIAWEVVPFSFIVDWFVPLGTFFASLSAGIAADFYCGYTTEWSKGDFIHRYTTTTDNFISGVKQGVEVHSFTMKRNVLASFPTPSLYVKVNGPSAVQTVTAIALASQFNRR